MTAVEAQRVKLASKSLLESQNLPDCYDRVRFNAKCDDIFELIYSQARAGQAWVV